MKKIIINIAIAVFAIGIESADQQKNPRMIAFNGKNADVMHHICEHFVALRAKQPVDDISEDEQFAPATMGLFGYFSISPSIKSTKIKKASVQKNAKAAQKMVLYSAKPNANSFPKIKNVSDFLKHYEQEVRNNNFFVHQFIKRGLFSQDQQGMTLVFCGSQEKNKILSQFFGLKIEKLLGFLNTPSCIVQENNQNNNNAEPSVDPLAKFQDVQKLYAYLFALKKDLHKVTLNSHEEQIINEMSMYEYVSENKKAPFMLLDVFHQFTVKHLQDVMAGKYYLYSTDESTDNSTSSSKSRYHQNLTTLFIGKGVSDKAPHDFYKLQLANLN